MNTKKDRVILFIGGCLVIGLGIFAFKDNSDLSQLEYRIFQTREIPLVLVIAASAAFGSLVTILAYGKFRPKQQKSNADISSEHKS